MSVVQFGHEPFDLRTLLRPELADLEEYTPILPFEVLSQRLGIPVEQIVKLDANENPYGPVPAVLEALAEYNYYHIYPDPQQTELREALAGFVGVPAEHILPTHGADEMLDYLCRLSCSPATPSSTARPPLACTALTPNSKAPRWSRSGASRTLRWMCRPSKRLPASSGAARRSAQAPLSDLAQQPHGNWLADEDLRRLLALPLLVVLDEAYVEFADHPSRAAWVLEHDNLVVLRTFSKAAGIAGLRLGYGICPAWLMAQLWKFKQPYNVNVAAAVAGLASLRHVEQIRAVVEPLKQERQRLLACLQSIPYCGHTLRTPTSFSATLSAVMPKSSNWRLNARASWCATTTRPGCATVSASPSAAPTKPTG